MSHLITHEGTRRKLRWLLVAGAVPVLAIGGSYGAALAHHGAASAGCIEGKPVGTTDFESYSDGPTQDTFNKAQTFVDGTPVDSEVFGASYSKSFSLGSPTKAHTFRVVIEAFDGPQFNYDQTFNVPACVEATTVPPTTATPTTEPATTAPPTSPTTGPTTAPTTGPTTAPTTGPTTAPPTAPPTGPTTGPTTGSSPTTTPDSDMGTPPVSPGTARTTTTTAPVLVAQEGPVPPARAGVAGRAPVAPTGTQLPATGANSLPMAMAALASVVGGAGLIRVARRPKTVR